MSWFSRLRASLDENPGVQSLRAMEAQLVHRVQTGTSEIQRSLRHAAEQVAGEEAVQAAAEAADSVTSSLASREQAVCDHVATTVNGSLGTELTSDQVKTVGRVVVTSLIVAEVSNWMDSSATGPDAIDGTSMTDHASSTASNTEVPTITYDGMGNMDGTVTITDGGVAMDM